MPKRNKLVMKVGVSGQELIDSRRVFDPVMRTILDHQYYAKKLTESKRDQRGVISLLPVEEPPKTRLIKGGHKGTIVWGDLRIVPNKRGR